MNWKNKPYWIVIILLIVTGIYINLIRYSGVHFYHPVNLKNFPMEIGQWRAERFILPMQANQVLQANQTIWRKFRNVNDLRIWLFVAYFEDQKYGAQIHSPKHCLPGSGWKIVEKEKYKLKIPAAPQQHINASMLITTNGRSNELMLYWFLTRSGTISSEFGLKLDLAKNALLRNPTDAALIRINLGIVDKNLTKSLKLATQFANDIYTDLNQILPFTNSQK